MKWHPILELRCYHYPVAAFFSSIEKLSNFKFRSRNQVSLPIAPHCRIAVVLIEIQRRPTTPQVPAISRAVQSSRASTLPRSSHDPSGTPSSRPSGPQQRVYRCRQCQSQSQIRPANSFFQSSSHNRSLLLFIVPLLSSKAKASQPSTLGPYFASFLKQLNEAEPRPNPDHNTPRLPSFVPRFFWYNYTL